MSMKKLSILMGLLLCTTFVYSSDENSPDCLTSRAMCDKCGQVHTQNSTLDCMQMMGIDHMIDVAKLREELRRQGHEVIQVGASGLPGIVTPTLFILRRDDDETNKQPSSAKEESDVVATPETYCQCIARLLRKNRISNAR
jgi:hypothetical protein